MLLLVCLAPLGCLGGRGIRERVGDELLIRGERFFNRHENVIGQMVSMSDQLGEGMQRLVSHLIMGPTFQMPSHGHAAGARRETESPPAYETIFPAGGPSQEAPGPGDLARPSTPGQAAYSPPHTPTGASPAAPAPLPSTGVPKQAALQSPADPSVPPAAEDPHGPPPPYAPGAPGVPREAALQWPPFLAPQREHVEETFGQLGFPFNVWMADPDEGVPQFLGGDNVQFGFPFNMVMTDPDEGVPQFLGGDNVLITFRGVKLELGNHRLVRAAVRGGVKLACEKSSPTQQTERYFEKRLFPKDSLGKIKEKKITEYVAHRPSFASGKKETCFVEVGGGGTAVRMCEAVIGKYDTRLHSVRTSREIKKCKFEVKFRLMSAGKYFKRMIKKGFGSILGAMIR